MKYKIIKNTLYEKCEAKKEVYTIKYRFKFLFWYFWATLKEVNYSGWGDAYKATVEFKSESDAIFYIKKLRNSNITEGWLQEVASVLDFDKNEYK